MKIIAFKNNITASPDFGFQDNVLQGQKPPAVFSQFMNLQRLNTEHLEANYITQKRFQKIENFEIPTVGSGVFLKLNNGHEVAIIQKDGTFSISTSVKTKPNEKLKAHILEHILYDSENKIGSEKFAEKLDAAGARRKAATNHSNTTYTIEYPFDEINKIKEFIAAQGELLKIQNETANLKLDKTKEVLKNEYAISDDKINSVKSDSLSDLKSLNKAISLIFDTDDDPLLLQPIINKSEQNGLESITPKEILDFYNENYKQQNKFTLIFTPTKPEDIEKTVIDTFSDNAIWENENVKKLMEPKIAQPIRADLQSFDKSDVNVYFVLNENKNAKENVIQKILECYLTDKNYNFQKFDLSEYNSDRSILSFSSPSQVGKEEESLKKLYADLSGLLSNSDYQNKLDIYKSKIKNEFSMISEFPSMLESLIQKSDFQNNPHLFEQQRNALEKITAEDVKNYLKKYIDFQKACVIVNHKNTSNPKALSFGSSLDKIDTTEIKEYKCQNNLQLTVDTSKNVKRSVYRVNLHSEDKEYSDSVVKQTLILILQDNLHKIFKDEAICDYSANFNNGNFNISASSLPEGTEKLINGINKAISQTFSNNSDLEKFQAKAIFVTPKTNFEQNKTKFVDMIQKDFKAFAPKFNKIKILPGKSKTENILEKTDSDNSIFSVRYQFIGCDNLKQDLTAALIDNIMGKMLTSKLETGLRKSQNLYSTGSKYISEGSIGTFSLGTQFKNSDDMNQVKQISDVINKNIIDMKESIVDERMLENAKNILKGDINQLLDSSQGRAEVHSNVDIDKLNNYFEIIDKITADDIKNVANKIFTGSKTFYLKSKPEILEANKELFKN